MTEDARQLYANMIAGKQGKPPCRFRSAAPVKMATPPGKISPHNRGYAADLAVDDPRDRGRLIQLSMSDPHLRHIPDDPNHFEYVGGGKDGSPMPADQSSGVMRSDPGMPEEQPGEPYDPIAEQRAGAGGEGQEQGQGGGQGLADALNEGRASEQAAAQAVYYNKSNLAQEGQGNEQALGQQVAQAAQPHVHVASRLSPPRTAPTAPSCAAAARGGARSR